MKINSLRLVLTIVLNVFFVTHSNGQAASGTDDTFVKLIELDSTFSFDMRYATDNNFMKKQVYECGDCIIRLEVAQSLIKANDYFKTKGYHIQFFDCYRPLDVQKIMWSIYPNASYVANPTTGSIHNRGGAVDITLVDQEGNELDMGTGFDYFGVEAHHTYQDLSEEILENRVLLKKGMEANGFLSVRTEWWHYNFGSANKYSISNFKVECD